MKYIKPVLLIVLPFLAAQAQPPYPPKAEAMVRHAIAYAKQYGIEEAIQQTNRPQGIFHVGNGSGWFLFIYDQTGILKAMGYRPEDGVGKNQMDRKDLNGKRYVRAFIETAMTHERGWVDYNDTSVPGDRMAPITTYVERYGNLVFGCGVYRN
jgi:signal transduction histidine kinase